MRLHSFLPERLNRIGVRRARAEGNKRASQRRDRDHGTEGDRVSRRDPEEQALDRSRQAERRDDAGS